MEERDLLAWRSASGNPETWKSLAPCCEISCRVNGGRGEHYSVPVLVATHCCGSWRNPKSSLSRRGPGSRVSMGLSFPSCDFLKSRMGLGCRLVLFYASYYYYQHLFLFFFRSLRLPTGLGTKLDRGQALCIFSFPLLVTLASLALRHSHNPASPISINRSHPAATSAQSVILLSIKDSYLRRFVFLW